MNYIYSWKSKLKHSGVDIKCAFLSILKSSLTKHKKCVLEVSYETSQTSKLEHITKTSMTYSWKQFQQTFFTLDVWEGPI